MHWKKSFVGLYKNVYKFTSFTTLISNVSIAIMHKHAGTVTSPEGKTFGESWVKKKPRTGELPAVVGAPQIVCELLVSSELWSFGM